MIIFFKTALRVRVFNATQQYLSYIVAGNCINEKFKCWNLVAPFGCLFQKP